MLYMTSVNAAVIAVVLCSNTHTHTHTHTHTENSDQQQQLSRCMTTLTHAVLYEYSENAQLT